MAAEANVGIIGGGVVGCSVLFELNRLGYSCILLEKNDDLMSEASGGNSGMLHTGFDAPADSLELHCIKRCVDKIFGVLDALMVPYKQNGSIMVAWNTEQAAKLEEVRKSANAKGVIDVLPLSLPELYRKEPNLKQGALGALWIPRESVLDSGLYGLLMAHHARKHGAKLLTRCRVDGYKLNDDGNTTLSTTRGQVKVNVVINCAGLHGDTVQQMAGIDTFQIHPRKGQYVVFSANAGHLINSSILPVPTEKTKGIIVFKTVHNNLLVGPTAEDVESRERAPVDLDLSHHLLSIGRQTVPALTRHSVLGHYTGVRPATQFKDYQICAYADRNWITVGGIRSTGVSGSLGIAEYVSTLVKDQLKVNPYRAPIPVQGSDWNLLPTGILSVDGELYGVCHPITLFGMTEGKSGVSKL